MGFGNGGAGGLSFADGKASGGGGGASAIVEVATGYPLVRSSLIELPRMTLADDFLRSNAQVAVGVPNRNVEATPPSSLW